MQILLYVVYITKRKAFSYDNEKCIEISILKRIKSVNQIFKSFIVNWKLFQNVYCERTFYICTDRLNTLFNSKIEFLSEELNRSVLKYIFFSTSLKEPVSTLNGNLVIRRDGLFPFRLTSFFILFAFTWTNKNKSSFRFFFTYSTNQILYTFVIKIQQRHCHRLFFYFFLKNIRKISPPPPNNFHFL